jgi:hypothetical protein
MFAFRIDALQNFFVQETAAKATATVTYLLYASMLQKITQFKHALKKLSARFKNEKFFPFSCLARLNLFSLKYAFK